MCRLCLLCAPVLVFALGRLKIEVFLQQSKCFFSLRHFSSLLAKQATAKNITKRRCTCRFGPFWRGPCAE